jgi:hypothetical protein
MRDTRVVPLGPQPDVGRSAGVFAFSEALIGVELFHLFTVAGIIAAT